MTTPAGPRESQIATWDALADGWERHHRRLLAHTHPADERLLDLADISDGEVVLELAAGLGALSRAAAPHVEPGGQVICSDASASMVAAARRYTDDALPVTFRTLDAQALDLADDAVDVVLCKMGLMLPPDVAAAASEVHRVLRPGGRLVAATWGPLEDNAWIATFAVAMLTHGHAPPGDPTEPGGIFSLATPDRLEDLLHGAGFEEVTVEALDLPERVASFEDYWRLRAETSGPLTLALQELDRAQVGAVKASCEGFAAGHRESDGSYVFPGRALITVATASVRQQGVIWVHNRWAHDR